MIAGRLLGATAASDPQVTEAGSESDAEEGIKNTNDESLISLDFPIQDVSSTWERVGKSNTQ